MAEVVNFDQNYPCRKQTSWVPSRLAYSGSHRVQPLASPQPYADRVRDQTVQIRLFCHGLPSDVPNDPTNCPVHPQMDFSK